MSQFRAFVPCPIGLLQNHCFVTVLHRFGFWTMRALLQNKSENQLGSCEYFQIWTNNPTIDSFCWVLKILKSDEVCFKYLHRSYFLSWSSFGQIGIKITLNLILLKSISFDVICLIEYGSLPYFGDLFVNVFSYLIFNKLTCTLEKICSS